MSGGDIDGKDDERTSMGRIDRIFVEMVCPTEIHRIDAFEMVLKSESLISRSRAVWSYGSMEKMNIDKQDGDGKRGESQDVNQRKGLREHR